MLTHAPRLALASILALLAASNIALAQRGRGGMVGNRGGGNIGHPGGHENFNRPTNVNQNFNRPTNINQNVNRPNNINQNVNRPTNINQNINRPTNINQNINRPTNINQNINRPTNVNQNINRPTNINQTNINRPANINQTNINNRQNVVNNNIHINNVSNTNINNVNRGAYAGYGHGYGPYGGVNRGWGGYGAYGGGYHGGSYYNYHSGWVNGSWAGNNYRPGWGGYGGYYPGYGGGGYYGGNIGNSALGIGAGIGIAAWGVGSLLNSYGYSRYSNPYYASVYSQPAVVVAQPSGYDYSTPLNLASAPPQDTVLQSAEASFGLAREAFQAGDYTRALALADQALTQTPNDPMLHEFRATTLFALGRYDEAAVPFYTVLSAGPGWDWTTLIGLYPGVETYTSQLRALEAYCNANARAASARFVLAALYLTQGSTASAATRLREVVALQPQDKLSPQLLAAITSAGAGASQPTQVVNPPANEAPPANPSPVQTVSTAPEGPSLPTGPVPANLLGTWTSSPAPDVTISLSLTDPKSFAWKLVEKGQAREFKGEATFDQDTLALIAPEMPPMVAKVTWKDPAHFNFKAVATPSDDPGLNFGK